ncbi:hypothetical protein [Geobacter sp. AOG2]|uniref:hypothetical protein n=1 Tax=Geobacter sp. AOG2 TaxID=1566347 RepID=UPI001CC33D9E|nr:hypothetical protein [Geobacter sp. AOG2]GFE62744.1 hypothetical protein AOG2_33320 [Geobacter sp. AOG2]
MSKKLVIGGAVAVLILVFAGYLFWDREPQEPADDTFTKINAVWAVQGPFKNGTESAQAMRYATKAVGGPESFYSEIDKHVAAYDAHPGRWEEIRKSSLQFAKGPGFEASLDAAKKLGAVVNPNYAASAAH